MFNKNPYFNTDNINRSESFYKICGRINSSDVTITHTKVSYM